MFHLYFLLWFKNKKHTLTKRRKLVRTNFHSDPLRRMKGHVEDDVMKVKSASFSFPRVLEVGAYLIDRVKFFVILAVGQLSQNKVKVFSCLL